MRVRLSDIAALANVSTATVSYVLNGKGKRAGISDETSERIKRIAEEKGFVPNRTASFLKSGRYNLIALISPHCADFYADLLRGIEGEGEKSDYQILFSSTFNSIEREVSYMKSLMARRVDGVVILPVDVHLDHMRYFIQNHVPTVCFRRRADSELDLKFMTFDDREGSYMATAHLIAQGCQNIGFFTAPTFSEVDYLRIVQEARIRGYYQALEDAGIPRERGVVVNLGENSPDFAERIMEEVTGRKLDGIAAVSDRTAIPIMNVLCKRGIRIPEDFMITGFDDSEYAQISRPTLTTIGLPKVRLGEAMVQAILRMIETRTQETDEVLFPPVLRVRESSGAA